MNFDNTDKKRIVQIGVVLLIAFGTVYLFMPTKRKSLKANDESMKEPEAKDREHMAPPVVEEEALATNVKSQHAHAALTAYISAYNDGAPQSEIDELNKELENEMGVTVIRRRSDNKLVVKDLNGDMIMVYPA